MSGSKFAASAGHVLYMAAVVGIGIYFAGRANKDAESYFLGGQPRPVGHGIQRGGLGYVRLSADGPARPRVLDGACRRGLDLYRPCHRHISQLPDRLSGCAAIRSPWTLSRSRISSPNRFHEKKKIIMTICSLIIIIFFSVYAAQCLSTCGKAVCEPLRLLLRRHDDRRGVFVLAYTFLGGYLAESASDFMQGVVMVTVPRADPRPVRRPQADCIRSSITRRTSTASSSR